MPGAGYGTEGGVGHPGIGPGGDPSLPFGGYPPEAFGNRPGMGYTGVPQTPASNVNGLPLDVPPADYTAPTLPVGSPSIGGNSIPGFASGPGVASPNYGTTPGPFYTGSPSQYPTSWTIDPSAPGGAVPLGQLLSSPAPGYWSQGPAFAIGGDPGAFSARDAARLAKVK